MPGVTSPATVLVTGASGFLATHITVQLLKDGYTVVGTVRSNSKGDYLKKLHNSENFSYAIVTDIEKEDAFDEVVKSNKFEGILHTASPFHFSANDPQEVIGPAVAGTVGILRSAKEFGPTVKRVVITSSVAAITSPKGEPPYSFTEFDWNEASPANVEKLGAKAMNGDKYSASKTLAEKAAWNFVKENEVSFDLSTINPPYIFGSVIHEMSSVSSLNQSNELFLDNIIRKPSSVRNPGKYYGNFADVRTVAKAHSLALSKDVAGGERFIVSSGPFSWQDFYDALNNAKIPSIPKGEPNSQQRNTYTPHDATKSKTVLGLEYYTLLDTAKETLKGLKERFPEEFNNPKL